MDDDELRRRFAELKKRDARMAPDFLKMRNAPRPKRSPWRVIIPMASLAAAAAMVVLWCGASQSTMSASHSAAPAAAAPAAAPAAMGGERAVATYLVPDPTPLDFLLETPGSSGGGRVARTSVGSNNPIKGW